LFISPQFNLNGRQNIEVFSVFQIAENQFGAVKSDLWFVKSFLVFIGGLEVSTAKKKLGTDRHLAQY
jgi:hypothetical protein